MPGWCQSRCQLAASPPQLACLFVSTLQGKGRQRRRHAAVRHRPGRPDRGQLLTSRGRRGPHHSLPQPPHVGSRLARRIGALLAAAAMLLCTALLHCRLFFWQARTLLSLRACPGAAVRCPGCRALEAQPPQDYEPWAAALPYIYQLERLLPCYTGLPPAGQLALATGLLICDCRHQMVPTSCSTGMLPPCPGADWQAWVRDGLLHNYLRQQVCGRPLVRNPSVVLPRHRNACPNAEGQGRTVSNAASPGVLPTCCAWLAPLCPQVGGAGGSQNASSPNQMLFRFAATETSVPAEQQTIGYRLLRWGLPGTECSCGCRMPHISRVFPFPACACPAAVACCHAGLPS